MKLINRSRENRAVAFTAAGLLVYGLLILALSACSSSPTTQQPSWLYRNTRAVVGGKVEVRFDIADDANQNSPIAVDLVVVYDEKLMDKLMGMTAAQWFEERGQIRRDYLEGAGFHSWGWEWIPGQSVPIQKLPLKAAAIGGVIFAKYIAPGAHRSRINPFNDVTIYLRTEDFAVNIPKSVSDTIEYLEN